MTNERLSTITKKKLMLEALESSMGIVTTACKAVGISRGTHYLWMNIDEGYRASVMMIENSALDFAESKLFEKITEGDITATIFFLKTKGKLRGYNAKFINSFPSLNEVGQAEVFQLTVDAEVMTPEPEKPV